MQSKNGSALNAANETNLSKLWLRLYLVLFESERLIKKIFLIEFHSCCLFSDTLPGYIFNLVFKIFIAGNNKKQITEPV